METTLQKTNEIPESTFSVQGFEHAQRVSKMLAQSQLVPEVYRGKVENCMIALEMANRIGASPLMVMQNLHVIQGRPSWSSPFIIASLNSCGRFSPLRFVMEGKDDEYGCYAWTEDKKGEKLMGPKVTMAMVKAEGWLTKNGSKWKTMPDLMFRYRAAAFFGRLYAPDILMGMQSMEEVIDVVPEVVVTQEQVREEKEVDRLRLLIENAKDVNALLDLTEHVTTDELKHLLEEKMKTLQ